MKKNTTGKRPSGGAKKRRVVQSVRAIEKKLALIGYVRGKDWSPELIQALQTLDLELTQCQEQLRFMPAGTDEETLLLERVQSLELERFQLLGQLHGNKVNDYHVLIS